MTRRKPVFLALMGALLLSGCGFNSAAAPNATKAGQNAKHTVNKGASRVKAGASRIKSGVRRMGRRGRYMMHRGRGGSWILASRKVKALSLATLPPVSFLKTLNPWMKHAMEVSTFITGMGYHWATSYAGVVVMTNQTNLVTGVEATFPEKLGTFSWWDPPTTVMNAGVAFNSEHLYFISSSSITPSMTATTSDLTSWANFEGVNTRLASYVKDGTFEGFTVYAPPNGEPGIQVLVSTSGPIAGFVVPEPAAWGYYPGYYPGFGHPLTSALLGKVYDSVLLLQPVPGASSTGTTAGASRSKAGKRGMASSKSGGAKGGTHGQSGHGKSTGGGKAGARARGGAKRTTGVGGMTRSTKTHGMPAKPMH